MWKAIKNWEKYYEINEYGDVRNIKTGNLLKGDTNSEGYPRVTLYHNNKKKRFFRHRLVAEHFIENPYCLPEVNHIDGDVLNSYVGNLEWCTKEYNELHSRKHGKKEYKPFYVTWENNRNEMFDTKGQLARRLNVTRGLIKHWLHNVSYTYTKYGIKEIKYCNK